MEKSRLFVILVQCILRKACLPSMTVTNGLQLLPLPENSESSELENNLLIACKNFVSKDISTSKIKDSSSKREIGQYSHS